jgi:hypothetical protein
VSGSCNLFDRVITDNIIKKMKGLKESGNNTSLDLTYNKKLQMKPLKDDIETTLIKKNPTLNEVLLTKLNIV